MKVIGIVLGALLLMLGLSRIPNLLSLVGNEDEAKLTGRALVVGAELVIGVGLIVYGVRGKRRSR
jgi:hypothetical protein